jgi:prophage tail gpP-like protein
MVEDRVQLYAVNTMAHVRDDLTIDGEERPLDEDMLITRVEFHGGRREGQTTTLTLVPKDSIVLTPEDA